MSLDAPIGVVTRATGPPKFCAVFAAGLVGVGVPGESTRRFSRFRLLLFVVDVVAISVTVLLTFELIFAPVAPTAGVGEVPYVMVAPILQVLWIPMLDANEFRSRRVVRSGLTEYRRVISNSLFLFRLMAAASFWLQAELSLRREVVAHCAHHHHPQDVGCSHTRSRGLLMAGNL